MREGRRSKMSPFSAGLARLRAVHFGPRPALTTTDTKTLRSV
jgi:hypothetical protein